MLIATLSGHGLTFILDEGAAFTNGSVWGPGYHREVHTRRFNESSSHLIDENEVTHSKEEYSGAILPSSKLHPDYPYDGNRYVLKLGTATGGTVNVYNNVYLFGQIIDFTTSASGVISGNIGRRRVTAWSMTKFYLLDLFPASPQLVAKPQEQCMGFRLSRFDGGANFPLTVASYFKANATAYVKSFGGVLDCSQAGMLYLTRRTDGTVVQYTTSACTKVKQSWASCDALIDWCIANLATAFSSFNSQTLYCHKFDQPVAKEIFGSRDGVDRAMTAPPTATHSWVDRLTGKPAILSPWLDRDPPGASIKWNSPLHDAHWDINKMIQDAADSCRFTDMNSLQYVADLVFLQSTLKSISQGAKQLASRSLSLKRRTKAAANVYLGNRYGTVLTYQDTRDLFALVKSLRSNHGAYPARNARSAFSDTGYGTIDYFGEKLPCRATYEAHCKIVYDEPQNPILASIKRALDWDIWPTLQNCWDYIPFSFVVNWLVPIDRILADIDNMTYVQYLRVRGVVLSTKVVTAFPITKLLKSGDVFVGTRVRTDYSRWVESQLRPVNAFCLRETNVSFRNIPDALALIVQKIKS